MAACGIAVCDLRLIVDRFLKIAKLPGGKHDEEGFEQYNGFPQAGIEIVVACVDFMPATLGVGTQPPGEVGGDAPKVPVEVFDHFLKGVDFVEELQSVGKQDSIEQPTHARGTLAFQPMIVVGVERGGVRNRPIVLGVFLERAERTGERPRHPSAKLGTDAHGPQGLRQQAREFELNGFVSRNAEHVLQQLEMTFVFLAYQSLFHRQARAPILLDTPTT